MITANKEHAPPHPNLSCQDPPTYNNVYLSTFLFTKNKHNRIGILGWATLYLQGDWLTVLIIAKELLFSVDAAIL